MASLPAMVGEGAEAGGDEGAEVLTPMSQQISTGIRHPPSLTANMAWTLAGNVVYTGCQWGCSIAIAKLASTAALGQFSLGLAIAAPLFLSCGLQLRGVQATDARRDFSFAHYLTLRLITTVVALFVIAVVALVGGVAGWWAVTTCLVVLLVGLAKAAEAISDIFFGLIQQHERMRTIALSSIAKGGLSLVLMITSLIMTGSIVVASGALLISWGLVLLLRDVPQGSRLHRDEGLGPIVVSSNREALRRLFRASFPLGVMVLLISLGPVIPRFVLASTVGLSDLGIYSAITYTMLAGQTIVAAMGQAASPRLSGLFMRGDRQGYRRLLVLLSRLAGVLGGAGIAVSLVSGPFLLRVMYSPQYAAHAHCLVIVMVAATLQYIATIIEYGVTAARVFREQLAPAAFAIVVTIVASWMLIPALGLVGACWTLLLGQVATLGGRGLVLLFVLRQIDKQPQRERTAH